MRPTCCYLRLPTWLDRRAPIAKRSPPGLFRNVAFTTIAAAVLIVVCSFSRNAVAQKALDGTDIDAARGAGTESPRNSLDPTLSDLPIDAFMFLSESGSKVVVPGTTWEKLERLKQLEAGNQVDRRPYVFQSLDLSGTVAKDRAELAVSVQLNLEPTDGRYVEVPLEMGNFHRLGPPTITGVDDAVMGVSETGNGYLLWIRTDEPADVKVQMTVSARVQTAPANSLNFQLPDVPTMIKLDIDQADVQGEVISGANEVVRSSKQQDGRTRVEVEGNGGEFLLRWTNRRSEELRKSLLEVESRVDLRWDSPQDPPTASVRLTARSVKGLIDRFQIELPAGAVLLDSPRLGVGGQSLKFVPIDQESKELEPEKQPIEPESDTTQTSKVSEESPFPPKPDSVPDSSSAASRNRFNVIIPEEERQQRIDLSFELQLSGSQISAETPLILTTPRIVDSLRHRGELSIQLGGDYRLRWKSRPWVRSEPVIQSEQLSSGRLYRFQFDRGSFELPIWLSTQERRLMLAVESKATIRGSMATLEMSINVVGAATSNRLVLDDASWDILSISDQENDQNMETFLTGDDRVIQWNQSSRQDSLKLRVMAQRPLGKHLGKIEFPLPRVSAGENEIVAGESLFDLVGSGRTLMTVDLQASQGLTRVANPESKIVSGENVSRFRLAGIGQLVNVVGTLQDQPLRIALDSDATVELDGSQILTTVDWVIDSPMDLEGRLPIRIPRRGFADLLGGDPLLGSEAIRDLLPSLFGTRAPGDASEQTESIENANVFDRIADSSLAGGAGVDEPWVVTVDDVPATLRSLDKDRFELISDRLASGTMTIRWRHGQEVVTNVGGREIQQLVFPRPRMPDVTLRGKFKIKLRGDGESELSVLESASNGVESSTDDATGSGIFETIYQPATSRSLQRRTRYLVMDQLPREPVRVRVRTQTAGIQDLEVNQIVLRSAISHQTRKEQVLATIRRGTQFRIQVKGSDEIKAEALVDGNPVAVENHQGWLVVELPGDARQHRLELSIWVPQPAMGSINRIGPLIEFPDTVGRIFWQVIAPLDSHVVWASPTVGRAMSWEFDRWRLFRRSSLNDQDLAKLVGSTSDQSSPGNRYLYVGTDLPAFEVMIASRTFLWMIVASTVLCLSILLTYVPVTRHPMTAVVVAILFAGLIVIAPDAAVLAGQLGIVSLVLVIVMVAIRSLLIPGRNDRVFPTAGQTTNDLSLTKTIDSPVLVEQAALIQAPVPSFSAADEISETQTNPALPPAPNDSSSSGSGVTS